MHETLKNYCAKNSKKIKWLSNPKKHFLETFYRKHLQFYFKWKQKISQNCVPKLDSLINHIT